MTSADEVVELHLPARPALIGLVRRLAADLAARAGFDCDAVSDLRMAVDEAVNLLAGWGTGDAAMHCRFATCAGGMEAAIAAQISTGTAATLDTASITAGPDGTGTGATSMYVWRIMHALMDELHLHLEQVPGHPDGGSHDAGPDPRTRVVIRMVKRAPEGAASGDTGQLLTG